MYIYSVAMVKTFVVELRQKEITKSKNESLIY